MIDARIECPFQLTEQFSLRTTVSPSSPTITPPPPPPSAFESPCRSRSRAAIWANMLLCKSQGRKNPHRSAIVPCHPRNPVGENHGGRDYPREGAYRDVRLLHPSLSLHVVLADDLVALVHALSAGETLALVATLRIFVVPASVTPRDR